MKTKIIFLMAAMLLMSVCLFAQNGNTPLKGDVNGDGKVDVADIVAILKIMKDAGGQGESKENTVTFIDRGTILKTITGQEGTPVTAPSNPTRSGYEFKGWNENESAGVGGQVITTIGTSDVTYYAQWQEVPEQTTYYWYAGQTDPSTMTSISPIVTDYTTGGGWYELGTTVPETITQLVKGGDSSKYWYVAVPITSGTTLKPVTSDMTTLDTSVTAQGTKPFNGITYQIYWCGGATAARNTFRYAKK